MIIKRKYVLSVLVGLISIAAGVKSRYFVPCVLRCQQARELCGNRATLSMARLNACAAVDDNFGPAYDCQAVCRQSPRTSRFNGVK